MPTIGAELRGRLRLRKSEGYLALHGGSGGRWHLGKLETKQKKETEKPEEQIFSVRAVGIALRCRWGAARLDPTLHNTAQRSRLRVYHTP